MLAFLARRLSGEPLAYITGEWEFYSLPMELTPDALIPRVDTETLAGRAISILRDAPRNLQRVLDLCCGTGCIGIAVAANVTDARVVLVDTLEPALRLARRNTLRNGLTKRVMVSSADALAPPPRLFGTFDLIVCNPPYIPSRDIPLLDKSVRDFEPRIALDGGEDGLVFYRSISALWKTVLRSGGSLLFECGIGQANDVAEIMSGCGFADIMITKDLGGIARVVEGTTPLT
jgi:release factor glutamine methyltransferase